MWRCKYLGYAIRARDGQVRSVKYCPYGTKWPNYMRTQVMLIIHIYNYKLYCSLVRIVEMS